MSSSHAATEPRLVTTDGNFDWPAIAIEVGDRCTAQVERVGWANYEFHAHQVQCIASRQRWPFVEAITGREWTLEESIAERALREAARHQPITQSGNARFEDLHREAEAIRDAVLARAMNRLEAARAHAGI